MRIIASRRSLIDSLVEIVGIKSGLLLSRDRLTTILDQTYDSVDDIALVLGGSRKWWEGDEAGIVAVRAEEYEANFVLAMHSIGAIPDRRPPYQLLVDFVRKNAGRLGIDGSDPKATYETCMRFLVQMLFDEEAPNGDEELMLEYQRRYILNRSTPIRREWDGIISLDDLLRVRTFH